MGTDWSVSGLTVWVCDALTAPCMGRYEQVPAAVAHQMKASKTLNRLLAAHSVGVEDVVAEFKTVRKQASPRNKKPKATAA